ncbi:hypothetical protein [Methyloligella solikamskensis]|uniref:Transporter n=1 Tax=Methyloligella solikamskensis TaxID=1177756 RepID=A0ABW3J8Z5_9HYPH
MKVRANPKGTAKYASRIYWLAWAIALCLVLALPAQRALAGGTSAPGFTSGIPIYAIFPKGMYYLNQTLSNEREVGEVDNRSNANVFFFYYQSDIEIANGPLSFVVAPTVFDVTTTAGYHNTGLYNTYFATQISWEIADGLYVGGRLGGYIPQEDDIAYNYGTIEPRFGATYLKGGWQATANFMFGFPTGGSDADIAPNYFVTDLSVTKAFGKWSVGPVAHASADLESPYPGYEEQSQFALGGACWLRFRGRKLTTEADPGYHRRELWGQGDRRLDQSVGQTLVRKFGVPVDLVHGDAAL